MVARAVDQNSEIWAGIPSVTSSMSELKQIKVTFCFGASVILPGKDKEWLQISPLKNMKDPPRKAVTTGGRH